MTVSGRKKPRLPALPLLVCLFFSAVFTCKLLGHFSPWQRFALLSVQSGSMLPVLPVNSVIAVDRQNILPVNVGDIITFYAPSGLLITHRVVEKGFDGRVYYVTKGDANTGLDPYKVRPEQLFGKVVYITPAPASVVLGQLRSPPAFLLLCFFIVLSVARLAGGGRTC